MEMLSLWQELDLSSKEEWEYVGDNALYRKKLKTKMTFEFLVGLSCALDDVCGRILV